MDAGGSFHRSLTGSTGCELPKENVINPFLWNSFRSKVGSCRMHTIRYVLLQFHGIEKSTFGFSSIGTLFLSKLFPGLSLQLVGLRAQSFSLIGYGFHIDGSFLFGICHVPIST